VTRPLRPLAALALILALAAAAAGCGGDDDASTASTAAATSAVQDRAVAFATCMRENGVDEFPDPDASGELTIDGVLNGSSIDPGSRTWTRAVEACRDLQPPGFTGDDEVTDEERDTRLAFAECMRENGVRDFPDPVDGEPLVNTNRIPSAATESGMGVLNAAMRACADLGPQADGGQP